MAARSSTKDGDTPTPKEQNETGEAVAAADGSGVAPADAAPEDKLIQTVFPHDSFGPIVIEAGTDKKPAISYTLTRAGVVVKADHVQAVRDAAYASHVRLRTLKAPTTS